MIFGNKKLEEKIKNLEYKIDQLERKYDNLFLNIVKLVYPCSKKKYEFYNGLKVTEIESKIIKNYKQLDCYTFAKGIEYTVYLKHEKDGSVLKMIEHFEIEQV